MRIPFPSFVPVTPFCVPFSQQYSSRKSLSPHQAPRTVALFSSSNSAGHAAKNAHEVSAPQSVAPASSSHRTATVSRQTKETSVSVSLDLDGIGTCDVKTGIPFLDHMLNQISSHGLIDLHVRADGDYWIDDHHTNEDVAITLGMAFARALGDKKGIRRFGHFVAPLDESLVEVVLDFSGRPHVEYGLSIPTQRVGTYDTQLVREFYMGLAGNAQMTLHVVQRAGVNSHHIIEASFKAFARAMRMAVEMDPRRLDSIPSSKGALTDNVALGET